MEKGRVRSSENTWDRLVGDLRAKDAQLRMGRPLELREGFLRSLSTRIARVFA
ncbi:hypothetical protein PMIT1303_01464 [Prochlorococcus sp. MIT 1303]|nr:hypothetical protein PMIT1303_01464 [Prochlorococcus sp. MIT 1303]